MLLQAHVAGSSGGGGGASSLPLSDVMRSLANCIAELPPSAEGALSAIDDDLCELVETVVRSALERFVSLGDKERLASCRQLWWLVCAVDCVDARAATELVHKVLIREGLLLARPLPWTETRLGAGAARA